MNEYQFLNLFAEIFFVLPPAYPLSDSDFTEVKDLDKVFVAQWGGENWLTSIASRTSDRYLSYWRMEEKNVNTIQYAETLMWIELFTLSPFAYDPATKLFFDVFEFKTSNTI